MSKKRVQRNPVFKGMMAGGNCKHQVIPNKKKNADLKQDISTLTGRLEEDGPYLDSLNSDLYKWIETRTNEAQVKFLDVLEQELIKEFIESLGDKDD